MDGHRHQRHAHLLTGGEQHVHLAGGWLIGISLARRTEIVRVLAHRADDDNNLVPLLPGADSFASRGTILLDIGNAGPPNFCTIRDMGKETLEAKTRRKAGKG